MKIGNELKLLLAKNLFRFEDLEFSTEKIQGILNEKVEALNSIELGDLAILNGIRRLFEYIEKLNIKELCIEVEFYKTLNGILAFNQSLDPGRFREGNQLVYISSIKDPIKPAPLSFIKERLELLSHLDKDNYKKVVSRVFCQLCKAQPFFDGNKRSTLCLCNVALLKQKLGVMLIKNELYPEFDKLLTKFYANNDEELLNFLETKSFYDLQ